MSTPVNRLQIFDKKERQSLDQMFRDAYIQLIGKDVITTTGDLIYASSSAVPSRLAIGSANTILGVSAGIPSWQAATYVTNSILTTRGDLLTRDASTSVRLAIGANTRILGSDGTDAAWKAQSFIDHGSIGGLSDDDHTQYILADGTRAFSGVAQFANGTAGSPSITFASDTNTGIFRSSADILQFTTGGSERFNIQTTEVNVVGINFNIPSTKHLAVDGGGDTYFTESSANVLDEYANNVLSVRNTGGLINHPAQPCFLVTNGTGATDVTGDATAYTVTWPTEVYDVGGNFASNTFTAPITGKYYLSATVELDNILVTHTSKVLTIVTSNRSYSVSVNQTLAATTQSLHVCCIADMDVNDTATVTITVSGSTKTVDTTGDATRVFFSGSLIN